MEWHELWRVGGECQIGFVGVEDAPVVPSPSPDDLRDVCGSFSAPLVWWQDVHMRPHS